MNFKCFAPSTDKDVGFPYVKRQLLMGETPKIALAPQPTFFSQN
ncbi:hypothetical protein [Nodularia spumigena]|nr:hypothetical protein [Nodularia spumigena]